MTTIVIKENSKAAKAFLEFVKNLSFATIVETDEIANDTTKKAIAEAKKGKTIKCESFEDYLQKVK
ncbi:MAG: hypothetical protein ACOYMA_20760 [Bacteroidia bacterium]